MKRRKVCAKGHVFCKSSDWPTCPKCEATRKPADGFQGELAAPARRALAGDGLTTRAKLSKATEIGVMDLHGMGPNAMSKLRASLRKNG